MKKLLSILPFTLSLVSTILLLMMFAATGNATLALLIPFAIVVLLFAHDKLID